MYVINSRGVYIGANSLEAMTAWDMEGRNFKEVVRGIVLDFYDKAPGSNVVIEHVAPEEDKIDWIMYVKGKQDMDELVALMETIVGKSASYVAKRIAVAWGW